MVRSRRLLLAPSGSRLALRPGWIYWVAGIGSLMSGVLLTGFRVTFLTTAGSCSSGIDGIGCVVGSAQLAMAASGAVAFVITSVLLRLLVTRSWIAAVLTALPAAVVGGYGFFARAWVPLFPSFVPYGPARIAWMMAASALLIGTILAAELLLITRAGLAAALLCVVVQIVVAAHVLPAFGASRDRSDYRYQQRTAMRSFRHDCSRLRRSAPVARGPLHAWEQRPQ